MRNHLISFALSFMGASTSDAPDPVRLRLEAESAKWFRDLLISGGVVAFGCLLEVWETAVSIRNWLKARRGLEVNENPKSWGIPIAAIGLFLVIGGVAAEVLYEGLSSNADARLRSHESEVLSRAEEKTASADGKAEDAEKKEGELDKEAAQLRKEAEHERLKRMRLEVLVAPRELTSVQEREIAAKCQKFASRKITFFIQSYGLDAESAALATQILDLLRSVFGSENVIDERASLLSSSGFEEGIHIRGPSSEADLVVTLNDAFSRIGNLASFANDPRFSYSGATETVPGAALRAPRDRDGIGIMVGIRPSGSLKANAQTIPSKTGGITILNQ
jgi:hypothetical protein